MWLRSMFASCLHTDHISHLFYEPTTDRQRNRPSSAGFCQMFDSPPVRAVVLPQGPNLPTSITFMLEAEIKFRPA